MIDFAVVATNGSSLNLARCAVRQCEGDGVIIEGGSKTSAHIVNNTFEGCRTGVRVGNGSVNALLSKNEFRACKIGFYVAIDATGNVAEQECTTTNSGGRDRVILNGSRCDVVVNNTLLPPDVLLERVRQTKSTFASLGVKYGYPVSRMGKKLLQQAGCLDSVCAMCKTVASTNIVYNRCSRCREMCYCSKTCQRAHWDSHFLECRTLVLKSAKLSTNGYISCNKCGQVEVQCRNVPHSACSKCVSVVYCSKVCQHDDWAEHKKSCKPCR